MDSRRFILVMSCLTALFCILTVVYNFASAPAFGGVPVAVLASAGTGASSGGAAVSQAPAVPSDGDAGDDDAAPAGETTAASSRASSHTSSRASSSAAAVRYPVNVNTAGREELTALPGIGETIADRMIAYRQANGAFRTLDDLDQVKGIGAATLAKLKGKVSF